MICELSRQTSNPVKACTQGALASAAACCHLLTLAATACIEVASCPSVCEEHPAANFWSGCIVLSRIRLLPRFGNSHGSLPTEWRQVWPCGCPDFGANSLDAASRLPRLCWRLGYSVAPPFGDAPTTSLVSNSSQLCWHVHHLFLKYRPTQGGG